MHLVCPCRVIATKFLISDAPHRKARTNVSCAPNPDGAPPDVSRNSSLLVPPPPRVNICRAAPPPLRSRRADICRSAYLFRSDSRATSRPRVCGHGPPGAGVRQAPCDAACLSPCMVWPPLLVRRAPCHAVGLLHHGQASSGGGVAPGRRVCPGAQCVDAAA